ncbi:MAG: FtsW/RodA/SpoVE family cell cycle protein, partial [Acidimicrobiales bacterium]
MAVTTPPLGAGAGSASSRRFVGLVPWRNIDVGLVGALASIEGIGLLMVYAATRTKLQQQGLDPRFYLKRQLIFLALGAMLVVVTTVVDYRRWRDLAPVVYAGMCALLLLVVSPVGAKSKGHQAWFQLGSSFQLQPSEISKICLVLCLAAFASWSGRSGDRDESLGIGKL